jgi:hypothetical protein
MQKKQTPAVSQAVPVVDSIICLAPDVVPAGMPEEECGPACAWAIERGQRWALHQVLGFAATHAGGGRGAFCHHCAANVFVVSNHRLIAGVHEAAAVWALNHFDTYTEALSAVHRVRWLPVLDVGLRNLAQLIAREVALAEREYSGREPVILIWESNGGARLETACEIGSAVFGFVACGPCDRRN